VHLLLDEGGTVYCQAVSVGASMSPDTLKSGGFYNSTLSAEIPVTVLVRNLSATEPLFHLYCVAEDKHNNLSPFMRMLPVTLGHSSDATVF